jgi:hypothetical protein
MDKSGVNLGIFGIDHGYEFIEWELHALSIFGYARWAKKRYGQKLLFGAIIMDMLHFTWRQIRHDHPPKRTRN